MAFASRMVEVPAGLPMDGAPTTGNDVRWYVASATPGRERSLCSRLLRLVDATLLFDAVALQKERWFKRAGSWSLEKVPVYAGYVFLATPDIDALHASFSQLSFPVHLVGEFGCSYLSLAREVQSWFERCMDSHHVLRNSVGSIVGGHLYVESGPLVGQEPCVRKVDRHRRCCLVDVVESGAAFTVSMPLDVPFKS